MDRSTKPQLLWKQVSSQETIWKGVEEVSKAYDFSNHPYFLWSTSETTTREMFRGSQVPFRFAVESFSQALAGVLARLPRVEDRLSLAENIAEEHGHGDPAMSHKYTFVTFLQAMGLTKAELERTCPIWVTAFNHSILNQCLAQSCEVGAATLGIIEHLYVGISASIGKLVHERGWAEANSQTHYGVHEVLDVEHARELLVLAEPAWENPRSRSYVALGLLLGAYYFWTLYTDLLIDVSGWEGLRASKSEFGGEPLEARRSGSKSLGA